MGNPQNASLWRNADVYVTTDLNATNPADADTPFGAEWGLVGLLDGDDGFEDERDEDREDHYAWGGIIVRTSRKNFKLTRKVTLLEDNEVTRQLIWPGSTETEIVVPRPIPVKIAFETREGARVRRLITRSHGEFDLDGAIKESESELTKYPVAATIFPDGKGVLFDVLDNRAEVQVETTE